MSDVDFEEWDKVFEEFAEKCKFYDEQIARARKVSSEKYDLKKASENVDKVVKENKLKSVLLSPKKD